MNFYVFYSLFITVIFSGLAHASQYIETSSLLTCMKNSQLTASYFNVVYTPNDTKVVFDISAISTLSGYIHANIQVIVYGLNVMEQNVSMCDLGFKTVCPISAGRIDVNSNYKLDKKYTSSIPSIAFSIPDLDAKVRVLVYQNDSGSNNPVACVEAILSNGKTVQTPYASWPIAAISGFGLITSGVVSLTGYSATAAHIASNSLSLFIYFQNLAISAMMAVNSVPPIAAAWCQNFQWSMGIIHLKSLSTMANWYVQATGGNSTSVLANKDVLSISVQKKMLKRATLDTLNYMSELYQKAQQNGFLLATPSIINKPHSYGSISPYIAKRDGDITNDPGMYNTDEKNSTALTSKVLVLRGIQRVAYLANIEITSLFFTGIAFTFFFALVLVIFLAITKGIMELLVRTKTINQTGRFSEYRSHWPNIIRGSLYRLFLIAFPQVTVLCLWELTERDSVACIIVAIVLFILVLGILVQAAIRVVVKARESLSNPAYSLYGEPKFLNKYGFLYAQFTADCYYWVIISLFYLFIRSLVVAVLQSYGKVQAVVIFVTEIIYFILLCVVRPYMDKRTNIFNILIHLVNLINSVFFLIFSEVFGSKAAVTSITGVVLFVMNAICSLILLIFTIVTCVMAIISKNPDTKYTPVNDDRVCFIQKDDGYDKNRGSRIGGFGMPGTELDALGSTALSGHAAQAADFIDSRVVGDNKDNKFPTSRIGQSGSNRDSLNSELIEPGSTIYGSAAREDLSRPGQSYGDQSRTYHGITNSSNPFDNNTAYNSNNTAYNINNTSNNNFGGGHSNPYGHHNNLYY